VRVSGWTWPSGGDLDQDFFRDINQHRAELRVHRSGLERQLTAAEEQAGRYGSGAAQGSSGNEAPARPPPHAGVVARILPADRAAEAHRILEAGGTRGRLVPQF
jgi:hypothetical protein